MVISMSKWGGKVAIVTGASSGIGVAIVEQLVDHGVKVVGIARRVEAIEENAKKLQGKPGKLYPLKGDFSKEEDIIKAFKWVADNLGPVSILINNAGVMPHGDLTSADTALFKQVFDINVLGLCIATREAAKVMKANKINGHIIHIGSLTGHMVPYIPGLNVYPASKHAVKALTESLRQEFAMSKSKIRVTELSPGGVASDMTVLNKNLTPQAKAYMEKLPFLKAEDVADAVIYALSTPEHVQIHDIIMRPLAEPF